MHFSWRLLAIPALLSILCGSADATSRPRDPSNPDVGWMLAFSRMSNWLDELVADSDTIKKRADRQRLADEFERFETLLANLEDHKRELLFELTSPNVDFGRIDFLITGVEADLTVAQNALKALKLPLRRQLQEDGNSVAQDLQFALDERKSWVRDLRERLQNHQAIDRVAVHHAGEEALQALRDAEMALIRLVDRLRREPSKQIAQEPPAHHHR